MVKTDTSMHKKYIEDTAKMMKNNVSDNQRLGDFIEAVNIDNVKEDYHILS